MDSVKSNLQMEYVNAEFILEKKLGYHQLRLAQQNDVAGGWQVTSRLAHNHRK